MIRPPVLAAVLAAALAAALAATAGCSRLTGDSGGADQAGYPALLPLETLNAAVPPLPAADPAAGLDARAAALRQRAAALRGATP